MFVSAQLFSFPFLRVTDIISCHIEREVYDIRLKSVIKSTMAFYILKTLIKKTTLL